MAKKYCPKKKAGRAFTLIELLVVIAIIALLAALAVTALSTARAKARDSRRLADIRQIQTALEMYYLDQNQYPNAPTGNVIEYLCLSSGGGWSATCSGTTYMAHAPSNPQPRTDGTCTNTKYTYNVAAGNNSYQIRYCIGTAVGDIPAGPHWATPAGLADD
jgi:general secretion pathway protein G